jgi:hypothetical protein
VSLLFFILSVATSSMAVVPPAPKIEKPLPICTYRKIPNKKGSYYYVYMDQERVGEENDFYPLFNALDLIIKLKQAGFCAP